ncbi:MAG: hypothetical protein H0U53_04260 [Actinobacteria bacterium]|nr:hypothetical protein [Actinomycetota bacterium]
MKLPERFYRIVDAPMTWTRAILLGVGIWMFSIIAMGQIPSLIIYKMDQYVSEIIEFTKKIPGVNPEGLNPKQIAIIRDMINNGVQIGFLVALLAFMYFWQEKKRKRTGAKGPEDPVRGYMPGK